MLANIPFDTLNLMKRVLPILAIVLLLGVIVSNLPVWSLLAPSSLPNITFTPASPLYFLKSSRESIQLWVAGITKTSALTYANQTNDRVGELNTLLNQFEIGWAQEDATNYSYELSMVEKNIGHETNSKVAVADSLKKSAEGLAELEFKYQDGASSNLVDPLLIRTLQLRQSLINPNSNYTLLPPLVLYYSPKFLGVDVVFIDIRNPTDFNRYRMTYPRVPEHVSPDDLTVPITNFKDQNLSYVVLMASNTNDAVSNAQKFQGLNPFLTKDHLYILEGGTSAWANLQLPAFSFKLPGKIPTQASQSEILKR